MNLTKKSSIFGVLAILSLAACSDKNSQQLAPAPQNQNQNQNQNQVNKCLTSGSAALTSTPNWTNSVGSIFANNCQSCHGTTYSNYNYVQANSYSIMSRINSGNMPKGHLMPSMDKSTLQQWVSAGEPYQATVTPQPSTVPTNPPTSNTNNCIPTTKAVSFATDIQPIMQTYCVSCHSAAGGRTPYLDTYANVKSSYSAALQSVISGTMPQNTGTKVPSDKITLLQNWGSSNFGQ
ncbi:MAG: hypothetical protein WCO71_01190 [Pseudomonadota bacterium]